MNMIRCKDCNVEMIEGVILGQHPFELGVDGRTDLYISFSEKSKEVKGLFGKVKKVKVCEEKELKVKICPKCGKVELYVDLNN